MIQIDSVVRCPCCKNNSSVLFETNEGQWTACCRELVYNGEGEDEE